MEASSEPISFSKVAAAIFVLTFLSFSVVALLIETKFAFLKTLEGSLTKKQAPLQNLTKSKAKIQSKHSQKIDRQQQKNGLPLTSVYLNVSI